MKDLLIGGSTTCRRASLEPGFTSPESRCLCLGDEESKCCIYMNRVQNGSPGSTRFYGPVHLRRYWSVPVSTGPYILGRPVKFANSQDADNLHTIRKRMPIPFQ